jgi:magnesium chelatase family protein
VPVAIVHTRAGLGVQAPPVRVEVHLAGGLPRFTIVGLPETAVRESKERVRAALDNCHFELPRKAFIVNLSPADMPKEGGRFDLPIAIGLLAACDFLNPLAMQALPDYEFIGELGLYGELRTVRGTMPAARACANANRAFIIPADCAAEAALAKGATVLGAAHLTEVVAHLSGQTSLDFAHHEPNYIGPQYPDLEDVRGQPSARRALEVAASGGHNLLMLGPPGTGKTMLANRLPGLLPALDDHQAAEVANVYSVSHSGFDADQWRVRPFRAPHHTASHVALVGGGSHPRPGEISLAHHGVLFLDEMPEFSRGVLEVLREPLESGRVSISRAAYKVDLPAEVQLVAAMNPCPCGYLGDGTARCECTPGQITRYRGRVSGPLLDRIDLHVEVAQQSLAALRCAPRGECTDVVRERVLKTHAIQRERSGSLNAALKPNEIERYCAIGDAEILLLETVSERLGLSARACNRVMKVARTIADLDGAADIAEPHLLEAIGYRALDRRI